MTARRLALALAMGWAIVACRSQKPGARRQLLLKLQDGRPAVRVVALRQLGPQANREETAAIARCAVTSTEDVREVVAEALGVSPDPSSIELLGALSDEDPADGVRVAAVHALLSKKSPRVAAYVTRAYRDGGPLTRLAVSRASPEIFGKAVAAEAATWRERMSKGRQDSHDQIRAEALAELGTDATLPIIGELSSRLVDPNPAMAAAAAAGLTNARAVEQIPALMDALHYPNDLVVQAAAVALRELGPTPAVDALAKALEQADGETAGYLLDAIEEARLTEASRAALCRTAVGHTDATIALRALLLAGTGCVVPATLPEASQEAAPRLLLLAASDHKDGAVIRRARTLLGDADAHVAAAAAAYLGRCGEASDGALLAKRAQEELVTLREARARNAEIVHLSADAPPKKGSIQSLLAQLHQMSPTNEPVARPKRNALEELLARRRTPEELTPVENRPGEIELIGSMAAGAARRGGDVLDLANGLAGDDEPTVRLGAADVADILGAQGDPLRARLQKDEDVRVRLRTAVLDYQAGRTDALPRLAALAPDADGDGRAWIASVVSTHPAEAKTLLLKLAAGDDAAVPVAVRAVASVPGEDVDRLLMGRLETVGRPMGWIIINALRNRPGAAIDAALVAAVVDRSAEIRDEAVDALATRKACGVAGQLAPLKMDYSGTVRARVADLERLCGQTR